MVHVRAVIALLSLSVVPSLSSPVNQDSRASSNCKEVTFKVYGSAQNRNFTGVSLTDLPTLLSLLQADLFPRILVSGGQTLAGSYCEPTVSNGNVNKLQITFHSITNNRDSFSAQGGTSLGFPAYKPEIYSYVRYMNAKGYPTLALDRLGDGKSSHPEPILVNQGPYETALYHDLIQQVRNGTTGQLPRKFSTVFWIGNSYGSELATNSAQQYPNDIDAYLLTGFSKSVQPSLPGVALQTPLPAAVVMPARFAGLNPGYLTASIAQARTNSFFGDHRFVDFEQTQADLFFTREDVISVGQFLSTYIGPVVAPKYSKRVLVLTGEQDQAFCGPGSSAINPNTSCGSLLADTKTLFPAADYNWRSVNRTGHAIMLHLTAQKTFDIAARFLAGESFRGGPPA